MGNARSLPIDLTQQSHNLSETNALAYSQQRNKTFLWHISSGVSFTSGAAAIHHRGQAFRPDLLFLLEVRRRDERRRGRKALRRRR